MARPLSEEELAALIPQAAPPPISAVPPEVAEYVQRFRPAQATADVAPPPPPDLSGFDAAADKDRKSALWNTGAEMLSRSASLIRGVEPGPYKGGQTPSAVRDYVMKRQLQREDAMWPVEEALKRAQAAKALRGDLGDQPAPAEWGAPKGMSRDEALRAGYSHSPKPLSLGDQPAPADWGARPGMTRDEALKAGYGKREDSDTLEPELVARAHAVNVPTDKRKREAVVADILAAEREGKRSAKESDKDQKDKTEGANKIEIELRKELQGQQGYKDMQQVAAAYKKIAGASSTGAGDMSMIFGYMKLLDPNSTVREGEYAQAAQAGSVPQNLIALYNRVLTGEKLNPEVRAQFRTEAKRVLDAQRARWDTTANQYRELATRYGVNPDNVVLSLGLDDEKPIAGPASGGAPVHVKTKAERDALPPGTQYVGPDGATYTKG